MAVKLAIICHSANSFTHAIAKIMQAAAAEAGASVRLRRASDSKADTEDATAHIPKANQTDIEWADAVLFGASVRYGLPAASLLGCLETILSTDVRTQHAPFVSTFLTASSACGTETAVNTLNNTLYHHRVMIVPPVYPDDDRQEIPGGVFIAAPGSEPDNSAIDSAQQQVLQLIRIATRFREGVEALHETG